MALRYDTVSFLSDYGRRDEFVGVVHSVIRATAPEAVVIDVTHDVPRHDVRAGGLALARSAQYLCPGVVLAVVDPGVGSARRAIAVEVGDGQSVLVGPDNGLLAPAVAMVGGATRAVSLTNTDFHLPAPGPTFDGRDVFAPVAASLCVGADLEDLGELVDVSSLTPGMIPVVRDDDGDLVGEVMWVDHFGNCQLNVDPDDIDGWGDAVHLGIGDEWRLARRAHTYGDVGEGQIGLLVDSYGVLSIALDRRPADAELALRAGTEVRIRRLEGDAPSGVDTPVTLGRREGGR
jgi:S-adenosylmethionine hydrolase